MPAACRPREGGRFLNWAAASSPAKARPRIAMLNTGNRHFMTTSPFAGLRKEGRPGSWTAQPVSAPDSACSSVLTRKKGKEARTAHARMDYPVDGVKSYLRSDLQEQGLDLLPELAPVLALVVVQPVQQLRIANAGQVAVTLPMA